MKNNMANPITPVITPIKIMVGRLSTLFRILTIYFLYEKMIIQTYDQYLAIILAFFVKFYFLTDFQLILKYYKVEQKTVMSYLP